METAIVIGGCVPAQGRRMPGIVQAMAQNMR